MTTGRPPASRFRPLAGPYLPESRWTLTDFMVTLLAWFVSVAVVGSLFFALTGIETTDVALIVVTLVIQGATTLVTLLLLSRRRARAPFAAQVGLAWRPGDGWGIVIGLVLQVVVAVVVGGLLNLLPGEPTQQEVVEVAADAPRGAALAGLFVLLGVLAPMIEEILYRGVLLSRLRRSMGPWPAIVVSAAAFAGFHLVDPGALYAVPGLFIIGLVLGWCALARGDLGLAIAVHAGVNLTGVLLLTVVDDLGDVDAAMALLRGLG